MKNTFRYNKKRRHYAYIFKVKRGYCMNIILTTEPESHNRKHHKSVIVKNIKLYRHPNPNAKMKEAYIFNHSPYFDQIDSFDKKALKWSWNINDKRKCKKNEKVQKTLYLG